MIWKLREDLAGERRDQARYFLIAAVTDGDPRKRRGLGLRGCHEGLSEESTPMARTSVATAQLIIKKGVYKGEV